MRGLMQTQNLMISGLLTHAARHHGAGRLETPLALSVGGRIAACGLHHRRLGRAITRGLRKAASEAE